jgi:tetratricopeptide (TPR) repeat protein
MWSGVLADLQSAGELARELSIAAGDTAGVIELEALFLEWHWGAGNYSKYIDLGVALIERAQAIGDEVQAAQIMKRVTGAARILGRLDFADRYTARAREIAQRFGLRALLRELRSGEATGVWLSGDAATALAILSEVGSEAAEDGDGLRLVYVGRRSAEILEGEARYEEAVVAGMAALAESVRTGERWNRSEIHGHLAVNLLRVDRTAEAAAHAAEATAMVRGPEDIAGVSEAEWLRAHMLAFNGDHEAADAAFRAALASAERGEFVQLHTSIRLDHAEFLLARGRVAEAASLLAEVERLAPPPPWNYRATRRRALAAAVAGQVTRTTRIP